MANHQLELIFHHIVLYRMYRIIIQNWNTTFYLLQFYAHKFVVPSIDLQTSLQSVFLANTEYVCIKLLFFMDYQNHCNFYGHFNGCLMYDNSMTYNDGVDSVLYSGALASAI